MSKSFSDQLFLKNFEDSKYYLLLFILWPFLAFLIALLNFSKKNAKTVVYVFLVYYGLTFVVRNPSIDAFRYALFLSANAQRPFSDFYKIIGGLYSDTAVDIVEPLISFIVSRFTSSHGVYFAVWAAIFGFFYLRSIDLLYEHHRKNPGWNSVILLFFFIMILPITSVSGVRMWTAAWVFFYGAYHVVIYHDPKYFVLTLSSTLVHWSFLSANAILMIYFLVGNRNIVYLPLVLTSFVLPQLLSKVYQLLAMKAGGPMQQRYINYSSEGYINSMQEEAVNSVWFIKIGSNLVFYYLIFAIMVIQLRHGYIMKGKAERNLFSFLLLFLAFVNFGMPIPSFGERFMVLFFLFGTAYLFLYFVKLPGNNINLLIILGLFPMILYSAINFRIGTESINAWIFTPGFGLPLLVPALSFSDFLFH